MWSKRVRILLPVGALGIVAVALGVLWLNRNDTRPDTSVAQTVQADDLHITLQLDQLAPGSRVVDIAVKDAKGNPVEARSVQLRFSMAEMDMGTIVADAQRVDAGRYQASGPFFTMAGRWLVEASVQRDDAAPLRVPFTLAIAAPGEVSGPLNPLAVDAQTLAVGGQLYQAHCAVCHGATGKGDGPAALSLNPRPSDFTQHMPPGKHTDGQVFQWISDGYPGTAMPAWRQRLDATQIWQLVAFLRTFGQPAAATRVATTGQTPTQSPPPPTPATSEQALLPPLIFTRQGNIWLSDGSSAAPRALTRLDAGDYAEYPTLSPDGSQIAFVITSQGPITEEAQLPLPIPKTRLHVMRADGSDLRLLWAPERGVLGLPAWTPDGRAVNIGFADLRSAPDAAVPDRLFQITRVDVATGKQEVALPDARDLAFSRNGTLITFLRWHPNRAAFSLNLAAADGNDERELLSADRFPDFYAPRFSPDGRQVIFASTGGPPTDAKGNAIAARPASPLKRLLAALAPSVAEAHGAGADLWIVNIDKTGLRRLTNTREDSPMAVFSPDGQQIVMMSANGISMMDGDGGNLRKVDPLGDHGGLDWARESVQ